MSKFEKPMLIKTEESDEWWVVKGHDRPISERYELMCGHDVYLQATETWARIVPSGGNPDASYYVCDGEQYEGQRGAFPATVYRTPGRCSQMNIAAHIKHSLDEAIADGPMRWQTQDQHDNRVARMQRDYANAVKVFEAFNEMMMRYDEGIFVDPVADYLSTPEVRP